VRSWLLWLLFVFSPLTQEVRASSFHQPRFQLSGFSVQPPIQLFWLSSVQVQAAIWLAVPCDSTFGCADLSWIACL
jgi:hypothetical protein